MGKVGCDMTVQQLLDKLQTGLAEGVIEGSDEVVKKVVLAKEFSAYREVKFQFDTRYKRVVVS